FQRCSRGLDRGGIASPDAITNAGNVSRPASGGPDGQAGQDPDRSGDPGEEDQMKVIDVLSGRVDVQEEAKVNDDLHEGTGADRKVQPMPGHCCPIDESERNQCQEDGEGVTPDVAAQLARVLRTIAGP